MVGVLLPIEPSLDLGDLLRQFGDGLGGKKHGIGHLYIGVAPIGKNEVAVSAGDGLEGHIVLRGGKHILALNAKPHVQRRDPVIHKIVHAKTTPFVWQTGRRSHDLIGELPDVLIGVVIKSADIQLQDEAALSGAEEAAEDMALSTLPFTEKSVGSAVVISLARSCMTPLMSLLIPSAAFTA